MLSQRISQAYFGPPEFLLTNLFKANSDLYDPETNPHGYVNLGTSVNALCEEEITQWLTQEGLFEHQKEWQHYYQLSGRENVKTTVCHFLTDRLHAFEKLECSQMALQAGVSTLLESLAFALADPGDVFVTFFPTYSRFACDIFERARVELLGPTLRASNDFKISADMLDDYIIEVKAKGRQVKAFIYCNPNNPLGDIYGEQTTLDLMRVCKKHQIHFISDEIYAFSVYDQSDTFKSILAIQDLPDPNRTHFIWGLSKDFGLAQFRFGVMYSWNEKLIKAMDSMCLYTCVEGHIQDITRKMLSDQTWLNQVYFPKNIKRLQLAYRNCRAFFESFGCRVRPSKAGLFAWIDFSPLFKNASKITVEDEKRLFSKMMDNHKIYIPNGTEFGSKDPGWFRIVFAIRPDRWEEFCRRFRTFVTEHLNSF